MTTKDLSDRISQLITLGEKTLATSAYVRSVGVSYVNSTLFNEFRASSLSFIMNLYNREHPYFKNLDDRAFQSLPDHTKYGIVILNAIKSETD